MDFMIFYGFLKMIDKKIYFKRELMANNNCYNIKNYQAKLDCGEQSLKDQYWIAVVFSRTANFIIAKNIELFLKLKAGLIKKRIFTRFVPLLICNQIMYLKLKKMLKSISKIHLENDQHFYLLYWIDYFKGIVK